MGPTSTVPSQEFCSQNDTPGRSRCLIVSAAGKIGHHRQAVAIARRLPFRYSAVVAEEFPLPPQLDSETVLVIAAGRQSLTPARAIARLPSPRPFVLALQPVYWRPRDFDMIWAPRHDRRWVDIALPPRLETITAPSAVEAADRERGAALIAARLPERRPRLVGVLVGGTTSRDRFGEAEAAALGAALAAFAARHGCALAVTASRRTGAAQTAVLRAALAATPHTFVDAGDDDASLAYAGILELSDALIVTADSVAMLSDAATTGKPILGWRIGRGKARFEKFYSSLIAYGAMRWFAGDFPQWSYIPLDSAGVIAEALRSRLGLSNVAAQHK
nr:ELM1/GtrOC1 family putative glycosyltransferase [Acuticoccus sediminis]